MPACKITIQTDSEFCKLEHNSQKDLMNKNKNTPKIIRNNKVVGTKFGGLRNQVI